jgi:hypothetical protein
MNKEEKQQKVKETILGYLKEGMIKKDAAVMAGIDESTFYRWVKDDASFASSVEAKVLEYKKTLIKAVTVGSLRSGRVAQEELRRRWPDDFNVPTKTDWTSKGKRIGNVIVLPDNGRERTE